MNSFDIDFGYGRIIVNDVNESLEGVNSKKFKKEFRRNLDEALRRIESSNSSKAKKIKLFLIELTHTFFVMDEVELDIVGEYVHTHNTDIHLESALRRGTDQLGSFAVGRSAREAIDVYEKFIENQKSHTSLKREAIEKRLKEINNTKKELTEK